MKKILILPVLFLFVIFTACNQQGLEDDFIPVNQEEPSILANDKGNNHIVNPISAGEASFTIDNEDKTVFEKNTLLLSNNSINAVSYHWDFGNGDTSTAENPDYEYEIHGIFTVTLTITDELGDTYQASDDIMVLCVFGGGNHSQ